MSLSMKHVTQSLLIIKHFSPTLLVYALERYSKEIDPIQWKQLFIDHTEQEKLHSIYREIGGHCQSYKVFGTSKASWEEHLFSELFEDGNKASKKFICGILAKFYEQKHPPNAKVDMLRILGRTITLNYFELKKEDPTWNGFFSTDDE